MSVGPEGVSAQIWTECHDSPSFEIVPYEWAKDKSLDNAALPALSDKIENCCWAMTELQQFELDCTAYLRHIYDRLPGHLQGKWRKTAKLYRERSKA